MAADALYVAGRRQVAGRTTHARALPPGVYRRGVLEIVGLTSTAIEKALGASGRSRRQIAETIGVDRTWFARLASGKKPPRNRADTSDSDRYQRVADFCGMPLENFMSLVTADRGGPQSMGHTSRERAREIIECAILQLLDLSPSILDAERSPLTGWISRVARATAEVVSTARSATERLDALVDAVREIDRESLSPGGHGEGRRRVSRARHLPPPEPTANVTRAALEGSPMAQVPIESPPPGDKRRLVFELAKIVIKNRRPSDDESWAIWDVLIAFKDLVPGLRQ